MLMVVMLALSSAAFADPPGSGGINGNGCVENCGNGGNGNGGNPGNGGNGGAGGSATGIGVGVGIAESSATSASNANATNTTKVDIHNTNANSATGGNATGGNATGGNATATNTANGGAGGNATAPGGVGGQAVSAAVVEAGAASATVEAGAVQYTYKYEQQAPAIGQGSFAIQGCGVAGNAGGSFPGGAGFLGFGFTPEQCYDFMLAQAYESLGEKKAACDILRNSKAGKRQEKRGVVLPGCEPEVKTIVVVPPAPPIDAVTHEELNRAFKASQQK
jgi:hypothetical protein